MKLLLLAALCSLACAIDFKTQIVLRPEGVDNYNVIFSPLPSETKGQSFMKESNLKAGGFSKFSDATGALCDWVDLHYSINIGPAARMNIRMTSIEDGTFQLTQPLHLGFGSTLFFFFTTSCGGEVTDTKWYTFTEASFEQEVMTVQNDHSSFKLKFTPLDNSQFNWVDLHYRIVRNGQPGMLMNQRLTSTDGAFVGAPISIQSDERLIYYFTFESGTRAAESMVFEYSLQRNDWTDYSDVNTALLKLPEAVTWGSDQIFAYSTEIVHGEATPGFNQESIKEEGIKQESFKQQEQLQQQQQQQATAAFVLNVRTVNPYIQWVELHFIGKDNGLFNVRMHQEAPGLFSFPLDSFQSGDNFKFFLTLAVKDWSLGPMDVGHDTGFQTVTLA